MVTIPLKKIQESSDDDVMALEAPDTLPETFKWFDMMGK